MLNPELCVEERRGGDHLIIRRRSPMVTPSGEASLTTTFRKARLLVVDDEPRVRALLSRKLSEAGYECVACADGAEALARLDQERFDAVLADLRMPGVSGMELLLEVRKKHPYLAFLVATGVDVARVSIQAMRQGADDYLLKPFQYDAVVFSLERALEKKRMEAELERYRQQLEEMVAQRTKQLQAALRRVELTYDETLESLAAALDLRDMETAGHSRRVTRYTLEVANAMGCTEEQLKQIARGAYLHDIGKIGIPDRILLKQGSLNPEEREVMQTHARIGYELVCRIGFLAPAAEIVLTHQERYDGTGYPQGLLGDEIPLGSRIFAVADTLDAMTSDRPYRKALAFSVAQEEIEREAGRQFDPSVVSAFLAFPQSAWEGVRREVASRTPRVQAQSVAVARA
jgi:putative nucleotidyltransferase with HDIG domain